MSDRSRPSCTETTQAGRPCRGRPLEGEERCFAHSDALAAVRDEARRRGGENSSHEARAFASLPAPIAATITRLQIALAEVHVGQLPPARGQAMASIARALIACWDVNAAQMRMDDIERRIELLGAARRHLDVVR